MMGPLNSGTSWGPGASHRENFIGTTLIKVKSVKSDFDRRAAPDFEAAFLRNGTPKRESRQWEPPSRGRAIHWCRKQGKLFMLGPHNEPSSLARRASGGGIYAGSEELNLND